MAKGITSWIRPHTPIGRSKSQSSGQLRAQQTLQEARRTVSTNRRPVEMSSVKRAEPKSPKSSPKSAELKPASMPKLSSDELYALAHDPAPKIMMTPGGPLESPVMDEVDEVSERFHTAAESVRSLPAEATMPEMQKFVLDNEALDKEIDSLVGPLAAIRDTDASIMANVETELDARILESFSQERIDADVERANVKNEASKQHHAWRIGIIPGRGPATAPQQRAEQNSTVADTKSDANGRTEKTRPAAPVTKTAATDRTETKRIISRSGRQPPKPLPKRPNMTRPSDK